MNTIGCPVCSKPLSVTVAKGRKSMKPFIMLKCDQDGRHFRGFITDQSYVKRVLNESNLKTGSGTGRV
jgi:hypothetical protein